MKKLFLVLLIATSIFGQDIIQKGNKYYLSNTLIIKFKEGVQVEQFKSSLSKKVFGNLYFTQLKQIYPATQLQKSSSERNIERIYLAAYNTNEDPVELSKKISKSKFVEYAEPKYIHRVVTFAPNDSLINFQGNLFKINAPQAWDYTKGDSSVIIAIVDTGVDWDHPDLYGNIYKKNDGKILGIDLGGANGIPDDDPREDTAPNNVNSYHGTHVAGIASAVSNNKIGIASIGYNCSLMPVKVSRNDKRDASGYPFIYYGVEGIKWAADNGAKIINCSWGSTSQSQYEQEIINYATAKGCLIVAAAGNDGMLTDFYPASYKNVLSVVWNDINDVKNSKGNYGYNTDVSAPGTFILSTWPQKAPINNLYNSISGSSMASPLVAGLAGLVASKFKNYSALQIGEQIRATCDDVSSLNDPDKKYLIGKGRINALNAVSNPNAISVRATNISFIDKGNGNGLFEKNETINVKIKLTNYLSPINNLLISLETSDSSVSIINSSQSVSISSIQTMQVDSSNVNFSFTILPNSKYNHTVNFMLKFTANNYEDYQWFSVRINPTYETMNANRIELSITSKGALAFNDYPDNTEGVGFKYEGGDNLMFEGAFMYGVSESKVMDAARSLKVQSTDFNMIKPIAVSNEQLYQKSKTIFNDDGAGYNKLGIETKQTAFSFRNEPNDRFIIIEYLLTNKSSIDINNLYAGLFYDWDIPAENPIADTTAYDYNYNFAYAKHKDSKVLNTIVASALILSANYNFYPIDNAATSGDVRLFDSDEFTDREKWITLSSGIVNKDVGYSDISFVVSGGPFNIKANSFLRLAFVLAADTSYKNLQQSIVQSRKKYLEMISNVEDRNELPTEFVLYQNYPNPFSARGRSAFGGNPTTTIKYSIPDVSLRQSRQSRDQDDNKQNVMVSQPDRQAGMSNHDNFVTLKVYDILGREVATLVNEYQKPGNYSVEFRVLSSELSSGVYFYRLIVENPNNPGKVFIQTKKMVIIK
ncbi:MAG: S8 family serine peptidase [Stygiobacter sp.]